MSDQEPHKLGRDFNIPEPDIPEDVPEEEDGIDDISSNIWTVWETGKLENTSHPETGKMV